MCVSFFAQIFNIKSKKLNVFRVLMVTRNVIIEGGDHFLWDRISGLDPRKLEYGGMIITRPPYKEKKLGWDEKDVDFEKLGQWHFPQGVVSALKWMEFRMMGKQGGQILPATFYAYSHVTIHEKQRSIEVVGVVDRDIVSGGAGVVSATQADTSFGGGLHSYDMQNTDMTFTDNVLVGVAADFSPGFRADEEHSVVHLVERNHFFGSGAVYCREHCTPEITTLVEGSRSCKGGGGKYKGPCGNVVMRDNWWYGGYTALKYARPYNEGDYYDSTNKIFGASTGLEMSVSKIYPGPVHVYKSSSCILANAPSFHNFVTAECGVGVFSFKRMSQYPTMNTSPNTLDNHDPRLKARLGVSEEYGKINTDSHSHQLGNADGSLSVIIGRTNLANLITEFDYCKLGEGNWHETGGATMFIIGGQSSGWLTISETDYSGYQYGPRGVGLHRRDNKDFRFTGFGSWTLDGVTFLGFTGLDACGKKNIAIGNEAAGNGDTRSKAVGHNTIFGSPLCAPLLVRNVTFGLGTPDTAKFKFSHGLNAQPEGYQPAYAKCEMFDFSGAIVGTENLPSDGRPAMLVSASKNKLPPKIIEDCTNWHNEPERQDNPDSAGACLWWIREYDQLLQAAMNDAQQGVVRNDGTTKTYSQISGSCSRLGKFHNSYNNMLLCEKMSFVKFLMTVPTRIVSGSEVMYGPVGVATQTINGAGVTVFDGPDTILNLYENVEWKEGEDMQERPNAFLLAHPQPQWFHMPNRGSYRLEFTGDIGVFKDDYIHFKLMDPSHQAWRAPEVAEDCVVLSFRLMKSAKINVYYDGRLRPPAFKQSEIVLSAEPGSGYLHPMTRMFSFVLKGSRLTSLKFLDIVEVEMGVMIDFPTFFAENNVDPVTIAEEFKPLLPPNYAANYNPKKIVRQDPFVRNMAAVLQINPDRIRITNIVPGNARRRRMRLLLSLGYDAGDASELEADYFAITGDRRFLTSDDGIDLGFEISETDLCAELHCGDNGLCKDGACVCNEGFYTIPAYSYNSTVDGLNVTVRVNASEPCSVNQTIYTKLFNSSDGNAPVVVLEEVSEQSSGLSESNGGAGGGVISSNAGNATNATQANATAVEDTFAELVGVASMLSNSAEQGTLDLGYEVTEMIVIVPPDVCGVPGGDGTTCNDACGVPLGDNSTCTDVCGVLHGDGLSCLVEETEYFTCSIFERHEVKVLRSSTGGFMSGTYKLTFNGETTDALSVLSSATEIEDQLTLLGTLGEVKVHPLVGDNYTEYTCLNRTKDGFSGAYKINFGVEFRATKQVGRPSNYGMLPSLGILHSGLTNVGSAAVTKTCNASLPGGFIFEEQFVTLTANDPSQSLESQVSGTFNLGFDLSSEKPWNTSAYDAGYGVGWSDAIDLDAFGSAVLMSKQFKAVGGGDLELNVDESMYEFFAVGGSTSSEIVWLCRFSLFEGSHWLRLVDANGDLPLMVVNSTSLVGASVVVTPSLDGKVPKRVIPVNSVLLANKAAAEAAAAVAAAKAKALAAATQKAESIVIKAVEYVCGDGIKGLGEECDDGNNNDGDGCSGSDCLVESGFVCTQSLNQQSSCKRPVYPTVGFGKNLFGPFLEGQSAAVSVIRLGDNNTEVRVDWATSDYTAVSSKADNSASGANNVQTAGDYEASSGTLIFSAGETQKTIYVKVNTDDNWDGTLNEKITVTLGNAVGATILSSYKVAYITIDDSDPWLSPAPTASPTPSPTAAPTMSPTAEHCTDGIVNVGESDVDCGATCDSNCKLGKKCNSDDDCASSACSEDHCVVAPTPSPTVAPTPSPTVAPTPADTVLIMVVVKASIMGISKEDFTDKMIQQFERDMAAYYGVNEDDVLVTSVTDADDDANNGGGRVRALYRAAKRVLSASNGVNINYAVAADDRSAAEAVSAKAEDSEDVVKEKVEQAAADILDKKIELTVTSDVVQLQAQTQEQWRATQNSAISSKGESNEQGGRDIVLYVVAAVAAVLLGIVGHLCSLRRQLKAKQRVYIQEAEMRREQQEYEEELSRKKAEEEEEDKLRRQREEEEAEAERKRREVEVERKHAKLGDADAGSKNLEMWLAQKRVDIENDADDDDDDEALANLLEMSTTKLSGPPVLPPVKPPAKKMKGPPRFEGPASPQAMNMSEKYW